MATASSQGVHSETTESMLLVDILSNLPDQIAHYILSFLSITDLTRFGCVSKRCRELCLTTPSLNFDGFSSANTSTCYHRSKLLSYLDRFLYQRGDNKIQSFLVRWHEHNVDGGDEAPCFCVGESFRVFSWIEKAARCKVERLDLEMALYRYEVESFPSCIFLCGSLRSLVLSRTILKTPPRAFSTNLKYLELREVSVEDEGFFKWISCFCKCIEEVHLEQVYGTGTITIESSSLKTIRFWAFFLIDICHINISGEKLEDIFLGWMFDSPSNKSLNVYAPNLKSLKWAGNVMHRLNLGTLECLCDAGIFLEPDVYDSGNVLRVLCSLSKVEALALNDKAIKAAFREGSRQAPLYDVCSLRLNIGDFTDELVPAMVSLFKGMPNLCRLTIKSDTPLDNTKSNTFGFKAEYWKLQNLAFIHQLRHVTIGFSNGSNGIEFAKYVIECAPNLHKIVIFYLPRDVEIVKMKLKECKKISSGRVFIRNSKQENEKSS